MSDEAYAAHQRRVKDARIVRLDVQKKDTTVRGKNKPKPTDEKKDSKP